MDNFTHTLAALLVAETAIAFAPETARAVSARSRRILLTASAVSNNLPDADFVYAGITPGKLGYLLHHRGHTHTLVIGLLLGLACFWLGSRWLAGRSKSGTAFERRLLLGLCLLGPVLHLALDATNNYGVHPFWPLYSGWFYGDTVFIVEPWLWVVTLPVLIAGAQTRVGRWIWIVMLLAGLGLAWAFPGLPAINAVALTLVALVCGIGAFHFEPTRRLRWAATGWILITCLFFAGSRLAERTLANSLALEHRAGSRTLLDAVVTPLPGNPFCYSVIALEASDADYRLSLARVSIAPWLLDARRCPSERRATTARLGSAGLPSKSVAWQGRWEGSLRRFGELSRRCDVAAFLRFARAPYWETLANGRILLGDLRYDNSPELDFAELELEAGAPSCPPATPSWLPPRRDLLDRAGAAAAMPKTRSDTR
jgi:inner membrane protein